MHQILTGSCLDELPKLPSASVDLVCCDPPYPEIDRKYGRFSVEEWFALMDGIIPEVRRVLKPTGSAVFILQPNANKVGSMRLWLWEWLVKTAKDWNLIQDVYWWNTTALPNTLCHKRYGLMRPSVKTCLWFGPANCYRNQEEVLWTISDAHKARSKGKLAEGRQYHCSGQSVNERRCLEISLERGGTTPFNLLPIPNCDSVSGSSAWGHGAGTPVPLCSWWVRYACPPGGVVLDPFSGLASVGVAAIRTGRSYIGIERDAGYASASLERLAFEERKLTNE